MMQPELISVQKKRVRTITNAILFALLIFLMMLT